MTRTEDSTVTAALHARVAHLDARVAALEVRLGDRSDAGPAPAPSGWPAGPGASPPLPPGGDRCPVGSAMPVPRPIPGMIPAPTSGSAPAPVGAPRSPAWSRLPVWAGAVVTVGGVLLALVLASSAGWLSPPVRVSCGALLGVALLLAGARVARRAGPGAGSRALAGTGVVALLCSVAAATALYPLLPVPVGLAATVVVGTGGIGLADRWRSRGLALAVLLAAELTLPLVAGGPDALVLGLALALQLGVAPTTLRPSGRARTAVLNPVAAGATAVHGLLAALLASSTDRASDDMAVTAVAVVALAVGAAVAVLGALRPPPVPPVLTLALAPLPLLAAVAALGGGAGAAVAGVAALGVAGVAAARPLYRGIRLGAAAVSCLLVMTATALLLQGVQLSCALLGEALVLLVLAAALRMRPLLAAGAGLAGPGTLLCLATPAGPAQLTEPLSWPMAGPPGPVFAGATLVLLVAVAVLVAARRCAVLGSDGRSAVIWLPAVGAALYGAGWLVVVGTQLVLPGVGGFRVGHVLVTVGITVLGLVLLARGLRDAAARWAGFVLLGAALAKLALFDLVMLDGLARVAAFLGAGLLLLAAGSRYPNRVARPAGTTGDAR